MSGIALFSGDNAVGDLGEVRPDYVGLLDERVEGLPRYEGRGATRAHGPGNVPGVRRNQAQLGGPGSRATVRPSCRGRGPASGVSPCRRRGPSRTCPRAPHSRSGPPQPPAWSWSKWRAGSPHHANGPGSPALRDAAAVSAAHPGSPACPHRRPPRPAAPPSSAELPRQPPRTSHKHRLCWTQTPTAASGEPEPPHRSITEGPLEERIERRHIQQSLIHIKDTNPLHATPFQKAISTFRHKKPKASLKGEAC